MQIEDIIIAPFKKLKTNINLTGLKFGDGCEILGIKYPTS